jgi:hypothetical protein
MDSNKKRKARTSRYFVLRLVFIAIGQYLVPSPGYAINCAGTVVDAQDSPLHDVKIEVSFPTSVKTSVYTDQNGKFTSSLTSD